MTYEQFIERLQDEPLNFKIVAGEQIASEQKGKFYDYYGWGSGVHMISINKWTKPVMIEAMFTLRWLTGGMTGGSCWGGQVDLPVEGDEEPEWQNLDETLMTLVPNVSFLHYKRIIALTEIRDDSDGGDYYGNYHTYKVRLLSVRKLYEYLNENNLLPKN